ncbi:hypothetical protein ACQW02_01085 [Humitalea sp. 24SJ18S-53]|uniref:flagellar biosynthesis protein FlhF n=1 Tax=Humitalea sp. 24SJ18S-53 TaxID=3422307 RepID=UPI003D677C67
MRLKTFRASRMAIAMAMIREEMGEDAVILGSARVTGGVEVTAALEPPPPATASRLRFAALPDGISRPLLLLGPYGAGKTLTLAKLAARLTMAGARPLLIAADAEKAGAVAQLDAFARVLGLGLVVAGTPAALARALANRAPDQPVLIDTAGADLLDLAAAERLVSLRRIAEADVALVLPAGLDAQEGADIARAAHAIGARWMVPTRLDAVRRWSGWLTAAEAAPLALDQAGIGTGAADGLTPLTPDWLAARLRLPDPRCKAAA